MFSSLEATFGVIAAAAPSVRPLIGHNAMTTESYTRSKSHTLPLRSLATGHHSRREWGQTVLEDEPGDRISNDGDSQSNLWHSDQGIVKTMSIEVVTSQRPPDSEMQIQVHRGPGERSSNDRIAEP